MSGAHDCGVEDLKSNKFNGGEEDGKEKVRELAIGAKGNVLGRVGSSGSLAYRYGHHPNLSGIKRQYPPRCEEQHSRLEDLDGMYQENCRCNCNDNTLST